MMTWPQQQQQNQIKPNKQTHSPKKPQTKTAKKTWSENSSLLSSAEKDHLPVHEHSPQVHLEISQMTSKCIGRHEIPWKINEYPNLFWMDDL